MNDFPPASTAVGRAASPLGPATPTPRGFWIAVTLLLAAFALPLVHLATFAQQSDLFSHILLIPFVSLYALWDRRAELRAAGKPGPRLISGALLLAGAALGGLYLSLWRSSIDPTSSDALALSTTAFVLLLAGTCFWFLSQKAMRALAFPLLLLGFMIPVPTAVLHHIETLMQHGSAAVAHVLFDVAGTTVFYDKLLFQLPGITLHVAPECSGIRSTMALLIVSIVTGYFFMRRPGNRLLIALVVLPLALIRNGFRIFVIGELCVQIGPEMIDSFIHRRGGPIFFALSLVPFFLLVLLLQRRETRAAAASAPAAK